MVSWGAASVLLIHSKSRVVPRRKKQRGKTNTHLGGKGKGKRRRTRSEADTEIQDGDGRNYGPVSSNPKNKC